MTGLPTPSFVRSCGPAGKFFRGAGHGGLTLRGFMVLQTMCALLSYAALAAAGEAYAAGPEPVRLKLAGTLPFSAQELDDVVAARVATAVALTPPRSGSGPLPGRVEAIEVRLDERVVIVPITDQQGIAAARLVAVAIADLAAQIPEEEVAVVEASTPPAQELAVAATAARPATPHSTQVGAALQVGRGVGDAEPATFGVGADLLLAQGALVFGAGAGVARAPTQRAGLPDEATLTTATVRAWLGARVGDVDLLAGPFAAPYQLAGGFSRTGALFGAGALVRYHRAISARTHLTAAARADAFANRLRVSVGDAPPSLATPRVALALEIGLAWEFGR